jgi:hypothetical protein
MPSKLVRHGRVKGYRPTIDQLQDMLELAQRGLDEADSTARLIYSQGDLEFYPKGGLKRISPGNIDEIIAEARRPDELNNLSFSISQADPSRHVEIDIGPGAWTDYRIESADQTWAYGRYHELTDKLLQQRGFYTKFRSPAPEIFEEGGDKWKPAPWEPVKDWRVNLVGGTCLLPAAVGLFAVVIAAFVAWNYYFGSGAEHQQFVNSINALLQSSFSAVAAILVLVYLIVVYPYVRLLKGFQKSYVIVSKTSLLSQFSFRSKKADPVLLASFYVAVIGVLIAIIIPLLK